MKKRHKDFQEYLLNSLRDPKQALAYLNEALMDEDQRVFLLALKDVLEAQDGDMSALAQQAELNRENLYRIFSQKGNPKLTSLRSILHVLGMELAIQPHKR
jgi:probable addiction module antidote protein